MAKGKKSIGHYMRIELLVCNSHSLFYMVSLQNHKDIFEVYSLKSFHMEKLLLFFQPTENPFQDNAEILASFC